MKSPTIITPEVEEFIEANQLSHEAQMESVLRQLPEIYYAGKGGYWLREGDAFIPLPREGQLTQHLKVCGVPKNLVTPLLCHIRSKRYVDFVGGVAGHKIGLQRTVESGTKVLVSIPPQIIEAEPGEWKFLAKFFQELLGHQQEMLIAHMRQARRNLINGERRPLPALALVGPRNCGKTLLIDFYRKLLGGRSANALASLSGDQFNADTLAAELLVIDDEIASKDHRARTALAQGIKRNAFATSVRFRPLYREGLNMRPIQAIVIAVNDETEHLQVLPAIDESMADKLTLLQCSKANLDGLDDRKKIMSIIDGELPAFLYHLESSDHPYHLRDSRTGVRAWQNPEILSRLQSISPEQRFRELLLQTSAITDAIKKNGFWRGTAAEIEQLLTDCYSPTRHAAKSLLTWNGACGSYISRLGKSGTSAVTSTLLDGITQWKIEKL